MSRYFDGITTPIGRVHVVATDRGLERIYFPGERWSVRYVRAPEHRIIAKAKRELKEYFAGKRKRFTVRTAATGTPFQRKVWRALARVSYGATVNYRDIARTAGKPRAVRAAANAVGANPLPILVPCHRVVRADGAIGGYAGGVRRKRTLLALERRVRVRRK